MSESDFERFGVPPSAVLDSRPIGEDELRSILESEGDDEALHDDEAMEALTVRDTGLFPSPLAWLRGPAAVSALVVLGGVLVLLVVSQVVAVLSDVATLPVWGQYGVYALLALAVGAVVFGFARVTLAFARFKATPRYSFKALQQLADRADLRERAHTDLSGAAAQLAGIVKRYPCKTDEQRAKLVRLGFKRDSLERFASDRDRLLEEHGEISPSAWLARYRELFGQPIDEAARRAIRRRSLLVGAKTAAVPHGGLDTAILLTHAYLMIADLCTLYQLRTNRAGTIALTWRIIVAAFVAGRLEDLTDEAAQELTRLATGATAGTLAKASTAVAGRVVGKAAEGVVNATFAYRLGRAAMIRLRPLD
ncbi:MAG: hypothetical protein DHS20C14_01740 [Phycisphaeraceae bacterium]|nr:MAG: hypothetical protein DHS20C14_01740 [Phycisphaeraceae bacterium]